MGQLIVPNSIQSGLSLVTSQSFSTASTVSFNKVFTSSYENYRVLIDWKSDTGNAALSFRFRNAGADDGNFSYFMIRSGGNTSAASEIQASASQAQYNYLAYGNNTELSTITLDVMKPFVVKKTTINGNSVGLTTNYASVAGHSFNSIFDATTSFDGFSIYPSTSTISGRVRIYGYAN